MSSRNDSENDLPTVELTFESFVSFIEIYNTRTTREGIFLLTDDLHASGTQLELKLTLTDGFPLIVGKGRVLWCQTEDSPVGMAVQFVDLDSDCQELIDKIVKKSLDDGNQPFELDSNPRDRAESAPEAADLQTEPIVAPDSLAGLGPDTGTTETRSTEPPPAAITDLENDLDISSDPPITEAPIPVAWNAGEHVSIPHNREPLPAVDVLDRPPIESSDALEDPSPSISIEPVAEQLEVGASPKKGSALRLSPTLLGLLILSGVIGGFTHFMLEKIVQWTVSPVETVDQGLLDVPPETPPTPFPSAFGNAEPSARAPSAARLDSQNQEASEEPEITREKDDSIGDDPLPRSAEFQQLTKVRMITWAPVAAGTQVTIWGDGEIRKADCKHFRFGGDTPRELVKIYGIELPFREPISKIDSPELTRIRTGFHPRATRSELHIVLDLADPRAQLLQLDPDGDKLHLLVGIAAGQSQSNFEISADNAPRSLVH